MLELLVVLAIIALLLSIVTPNYFLKLDRSRETVLRKDLQVMREAIDHYYGDKATYPATLQDLVTAGYLRAVPVDPLTGSAHTWSVVLPPNAASGVYDIHSSASGTSSDNSAYTQW